MAGEAQVAKEAILENGALYFETLVDFIGAIKMANGFKRPASNQVVIVTNAGGPGVITTDIIEKSQGLSLFEFSQKQKDGCTRSCLMPRRPKIRSMSWAMRTTCAIKAS